MVDLTPIFNAIVALAAALITAFLIPWIKRKASAEQIAEAQKWIKIAVEAAEMLYKGAGLGESKKSYVKSYIESKGYTMDTDTIDAMIESAVLELKLESGWET